MLSAGTRITLRDDEGFEDVNAGFRREIEGAAPWATGRTGPLVEW
jgi:hypothetical protein